MSRAAPTTDPTRRGSPRLSPQPVARSIEELIDGASERSPFDKTADSLSGSSFERVVIGGEAFVLKHLHVDEDWIQRASGDLFCRPAVVWASGILHALPACIDHTVVGVATGLGRAGLGAAVLMRDVSGHLVDVASGRLELDQHLRFLEHMAELHAAFWGFTDTIGLMPGGNRYAMLSPPVGRLEAELGGTDPVPMSLEAGWSRIRGETPQAAQVAASVHHDAGPLLAAMARTPETLVHSDWKAGNLGSDPAGRTILIDWAFPGRAPACNDLAWYLAVNCDLLPQTKEESIEVYRRALERLGIDTGTWFEEQLGLCMIGAFALLGWSKSGDELQWWAERVTDAASRWLT